MQLCATDSVTYWVCVRNTTGAAVSEVGAPFLDAYFQDGGRFGTASSTLEASAGGTTAAVMETAPHHAVLPEDAVPLLAVSSRQATAAHRSAAAHADQDRPHRAVTLADLDLANPEDVVKAYRRIHFAATQVCPDADSSDVWLRNSAKACVDAAVIRAVSQARSPLLASYLADRAPRVAAHEKQAAEPPVRIVLSQ
jgi:UrcA family protein